MWTPGKRLLLLPLALMLITQDFHLRPGQSGHPREPVHSWRTASSSSSCRTRARRWSRRCVYIRAGSADEPPGVSGIAHFLEHLMFKSTEKLASGEFSAIVSRLGGQHNAFTNYDYTGYYERVAKDRLKAIMAMEADRMVNLRLGEREVDSERQVIIEERRLRIENVPVEPAVGADVGGALPEPSLPHPHHRLDARDGEALARGRAHLLQALLCAQQRHRRHHRRRQRRRGQGAGRCDLRRPAGQPAGQQARAAAGARADRRPGASSSRTRARAIGDLADRQVQPRPRTLDLLSERVHRRPPGTAVALHRASVCPFDPSCTGVLGNLLALEPVGRHLVAGSRQPDTGAASFSDRRAARTGAAGDRRKTTTAATTSTAAAVSMPG